MMRLLSTGSVSPPAGFEPDSPRTKSGALIARLRGHLVLKNINTEIND